ncbi:NADP-dependent 3-hydroxy acid dehydrogenase YdfG [Ferrimonas sediminum]|uniref:NADP-dependent 3-hydroxy acid dehydrogenase YdfG n=1 Tax=Ferrimonas sediminum TaxID=718193 RepID=A0A1G8YBL2_9GAMM|nr:short chain dehydrogenase [Ferrimonas sediminum]SDK00086.1 NADP-dependent 3-hydroxy acid dehydrogenase YdfG [Ferrimonas sediminum]
MKILLAGASGTIGGAIEKRLAVEHQVITAGYSHGNLRFDLADSDSIRIMIDAVGEVDAIICAAGVTSFGPFEHLTEADYHQTLNSKLMGQVNLLRIGRQAVRRGGSITLTSGFAAREPVPGCAAVAMANGALESFVKAVAVELTEVRVNVVSPSFVTETMAMMGMGTSTSVSASLTAAVYEAALLGTMSGETLQVAEYVNADTHWVI